MQKEDLEEKTGLEFNKIPYSLGSDISSEYSFKIVNEAIFLRLLT